MTTSKVQWDLDVRVRERNLKQGLIKAEDVGKMLDGLRDVSDWALSAEVPQPAVGTDEEDAEPEQDGEENPG